MEAFCCNPKVNAASRLRMYFTIPWGHCLDGIFSKVKYHVSCFGKQSHSRGAMGNIYNFFRLQETKTAEAQWQIGSWQLEIHKKDFYFWQILFWFWEFFNVMSFPVEWLSWSLPKSDGKSLVAVNGWISSVDPFHCETKYFGSAWTDLENS